MFSREIKRYIKRYITFGSRGMRHAVDVQNTHLLLMEEGEIVSSMVEMEQEQSTRVGGLLETPVSKPLCPSSCVRRARGVGPRMAPSCVTLGHTSLCGVQTIW